MVLKDSALLSYLQVGGIANKIATGYAIARSIWCVDKNEVRRHRLRQLKSKHGSLKKLARFIDPTARYLEKYLGQIILGNRTLGDPLAYKIAELEGQPKEWMDTLMATSSLETSEMLKLWGHFDESEQKALLRELRIRIRAKTEEEDMQLLGLSPKQPNNKKNA